MNWKSIILAVYHSLDDDRVLAVAAGVTFYALLAIFPAIGALVSLYGLFADPLAIRDTMSAMSTMLPGGALDIVGEQIQRVSAAGSGKLSVTFVSGLAIALWGANAGIKALFDAVNVAYGKKEERGFLKLNLISLTFTLVGIVLALTILGGVVILPHAITYLGLDSSIDIALRYGRWPIIWLIVALAFSLLYRFGPTDSLNPKWKWITWGSAIASLLWLLASILFSWYTANFGSYNETYGSLGAAIGFMTWLWLSATVIIVGAEINSEIEQAVGEPHA
ncbi:MAG: YihY/virulence factor BrkB family protein, partial [Pseudomonas sp.]